MNTMNDFGIVEGYRNDTALRDKFFDFTKKVFSWADFRTWSNLGHWSEAFIPISILADNMIVSNVSISRMKILHNGKLISGIQFGTVGTIDGYRGRGLSRRLMEYAMAKYGDTADLLFLFANDSVLEFYPKFGFTLHKETLYFAESVSPDVSNKAMKLDIQNDGDVSLIEDTISRRLPLTSLFGAKEYGFITWWHLLNLHADHLFYLEEEEAVFIMKLAQGRLDIWDVIYTKPFDLSSSISVLFPKDQIDSICYHFPPDELHFQFDRTEPDPESLLFVRGAFAPAGEQFKFPSTAQT